MDTNFFQTGIFIYGILPFLIFIARIMDVTIGTLRIVFISKGKNLVVPLLGFFEVLIWIFAVSWIMQNLNNLVCYFAFAGGFAVGNYIGLKVEGKLAIGLEVVRVITQKEANSLIEALHSQGYGTTSVDAKGSTGNVHIIYSIVKRSDIRDVIRMIESFNPAAFYTLEDIRTVHSGIFPTHTKNFRLYRKWRTGK